MRRLLKKYVILNRRNLIYGLLLAVGFGTIAFDGVTYYPVALLMAPSLLFTFAVGKMCYEEDSKSTRHFLLSLPVPPKTLILEKNIMSHLCIVVGMLIVNAVFYIINILLRREVVFFSLNAIMLFSIVLITYNALYIWLNYKFDYSKTQYTSYILLVLMFALFKFRGTFIEKVAISHTGGLSVLLVCLSLGSFYFLSRVKVSV